MPFSVLYARRRAVVNYARNQRRYTSRIQVSVAEHQFGVCAAVALFNHGQRIRAAIQERLDDEAVPVCPFLRAEEELDCKGLEIELAFGIVWVERAAVLIVGGPVWIGRNINREVVRRGNTAHAVLKHERTFESVRRHGQYEMRSAIPRVCTIADLSVELVRGAGDVGEGGLSHDVRAAVCSVVLHRPPHERLGSERKCRTCRDRRNSNHHSNLHGARFSFLKRKPPYLIMPPPILAIAFFIAFFKMLRARLTH